MFQFDVQNNKKKRLVIINLKYAGLRKQQRVAVPLVFAERLGNLGKTA